MAAPRSSARRALARTTRGGAARARAAGLRVAVASTDAEIPEPETSAAVASSEEATGGTTDDPAAADAPSEPIPVGSNLGALQDQLAALMAQNQELQKDIESLKPPEPEPAAVASDASEASEAASDVYDPLVGGGARARTPVPRPEPRVLQPGELLNASSSLRFAGPIRAKIRRSGSASPTPRRSRTAAAWANRSSARRRPSTSSTSPRRWRRSRRLAVLATSSRASRGRTRLPGTRWR